MRFALSNFLPTLKYLCVRGRYSSNLEEILEGYGFIRDLDASFKMSLKSSSSHRRKRVTTYVKRSDGKIPLPDLNLIPAPKERVSVVVGLFPVAEINEEADLMVKSQFYRAQVADYYFSKVLYVSSSLQHNSTLQYHPHTYFLPRDFDYTNPIFKALTNYEIDCIETDFATEEYFMEFYAKIGLCMMIGGRVIYLKSSNSLSLTRSFESELIANYSISVSPVESASQYYARIIQSESALRE